MNKYKIFIGLEIHVELKTKSKMFCGCPADHFGKKANTQTCPVCLGLPGALPVPNGKAIEWTHLIGVALGCKINHESKFDRKHYFYPDLPKGYQISQYDQPFCSNGRVTIDNKIFRIHRVHLEEDTGKLLHVGEDTLVDFNRSGVPLVEIVTEPAFENSDDVKRFLEELQVIIRYLDVSDADMEKGSMRLEPNISVKLLSLRAQAKQSQEIATSSRRHVGTPRNDSNLPKYKVEIKNINSFRFVKQAIDYEIERQITILEKGESPSQETRGFDEKKGMTYSQRTKEEAHDYRYFPEPDIPPLTFSKKYIDTIKVPELPAQKIRRYISEFGIKEKDAFVVTRNRQIAYFFEKVISQIKQIKAQSIANLIINKKIAMTSVDEFVKRAIEMLQPKETDEKLLDSTIEQLIAANKKAAEDYQKGKTNALMFLIGQVMAKMRGKADPKMVKKKLLEKLVRQLADGN
jgi:aspartyl-tRNA(Asn)/glutamyl-tRNA(Gln) amidotransferase subunit B